MAQRGGNFGRMVMVAAGIGLASVPAASAAGAGPTAAGVLTRAERAAVLNEWRHEDQDGYGSETFDYRFDRFQCYAFAHGECDLNYRLWITRVDVVDIKAGTHQDATPPYVALELPILTKTADGAHGWVVGRKHHGRRGPYDGHCMVPVAAGAIGAQVLGPAGGVTTQFRDLLDACLSANDGQLAAAVAAGPSNGIR